jgi:protein-tyrosine phosphatase
VRSEECDDEHELAACGLELLHLPTDDLQAVSQEALWRGVLWIREGLRCGERALVHCEHGIGRSALVACCALVSLGDSPLAALRRAKSVRWKVSPSPEQIHAYLRWSSDWHARARSACPPTSWDELADIAYAHLRPPEARR